MKTSFICMLLVLISIYTFAQAPDGFNYQGIARDNKGKELTNQNISLRLSILQTSATGTSVYTESHNATTNGFGLFTVKIGKGIVSSGNFRKINWSTGLYFLKVEMDATGGTNYVFLGTSQLVSVPYAMMANIALKSVNDLDTSATNELQILKISNDTLYLDKGGFVYLGKYDDKNAIQQLRTKLNADSSYFNLQMNDERTERKNNDNDLNLKIVADSAYLKWLINSKQEKLIAGSGITIDITNKIKAIDSSITNELQTLSISNDTIFLSNGGFIKSPRLIPTGTCIISADINPPNGYNFTGVFNSVGNEWYQRANMPTLRGCAASAVVNGKIYIIGGRSNTTNYLTTVEEYNPATNSWVTKANMPTPRSHLSAAVYNNKIYVFGGFASTGSINTVEEYNPTTNTWTTKANMPTARAGLTAASVNNKIYVIGGEGTSYLNVNQEYDPINNTWATKTNMPTTRGYMTSAVVNNKIYVIGGELSVAQKYATVEEYDPSTNAWLTKASMQYARATLASAVSNNRIFVAGGVYNNTILNYTEEYDPSSNTWITRQPLPGIREHMSAATANNRMFFIGGDNTSGPTNFTDAMYEFAIPMTYYYHSAQ
jgi:N-acetylneuraminic acid mutarotase